IRVRGTPPRGLTAPATTTLNVIWPFGGFRQPLSGDGTDSATAGATVVVKFSLAGNQGLDLFKSGYPASTAFTCGTEPPTDAGVPAKLADPLRYDAQRDEYVLGWKTDKAWAGTCRVLVLGLRDDTTVALTIAFR